MNVKILFFPLSVTIALAIVVFYIKPGVDVTISDRDAIAEKETFSASVVQKTQNVHSLETSLNSHKADEENVRHYLPDTRDDDRIVDGINFLTSQAGLALTSVKIEKKVDVAPVAAVEPPVGSDVIFSREANIVAVNQTPVVPIVAKTLTVSLIMSGSYESIRGAIGAISHMDRFQDFTFIDISRSADVNQPAAAVNTLNASLVMNFAYLPKVSVKGNFNRPILDKSTFDFSTVQTLKDYTSTPIPSMEIGAAGTNNPFLR